MTDTDSWTADKPAVTDEDAGAAAAAEAIDGQADEAEQAARHPATRTDPPTTARRSLRRRATPRTQIEVPEAPGTSTDNETQGDPMSNQSMTQPADSKNWACPRACGYHIADGPAPDGEPTTDDLIAQHMDEEHPPPVVDLTDELAAVLAAVADSSESGTPLNEDVAAKTGNPAALSVLAQLGYVYETEDEGWFARSAGREALFAREAARVAAARKKLADSYTALAAELRAIADAIESMPPDGLHELKAELKISPKYMARTPANDTLKVATVDAVTTAVLPGKAATRKPVADFINYEANGTRGPVTVEVAAFIDDPAEQAKDAELARLRVEVERLRAAGQVPA